MSVYYAENLSVGYRESVVSDINWTVQKGDFWYLTGANGEGKSTLLQTLTGLLQPLSGKLTVAAEYRAGNGIGFVPQSARINQTLRMSVRDFIQMGITGMVSSPDEEMQNALQKTGALFSLNDEFRTLSGGGKRKCLLARALVRNPEVLLLDEPFNSLDRSSHELLEKLLTEFHESGKTIVCVSHDIRGQIRPGSKTAYLSEGQLQIL